LEQRQLDHDHNTVTTTTRTVSSTERHITRTGDEPAVVEERTVTTTYEDGVPVDEYVEEHTASSDDVDSQPPFEPHSEQREPSEPSSEHRESWEHREPSEPSSEHRESWEHREPSEPSSDAEQPQRHSHSPVVEEKKETRTETHHTEDGGVETITVTKTTRQVHMDFGRPVTPPGEVDEYEREAVIEQIADTLGDMELAHPSSPRIVIQEG
jgi:hypothetical protein